MSNELLASKVIVVEEEPKVRGIASAPTSVVAAVGVAAQGPLNTPVLCNSFDEYAATFGDFTPTSDLALAAKGFFENGGNQLWVSRIDGGSGGAGAASVVLNRTVTNGDPGSVTGNPEPFALEEGDQIFVATDPGLVAITIDASAASITSTTQEPFPGLAFNTALNIRVDDGLVQTASFTAGNVEPLGSVTAQQIADIINAAMTGVVATANDGKVTITSLLKGTRSRLQVTTSTAAAAFGLTGANATGGGNVGDLSAVTIADIASAAEDAGADGSFDVYDNGDGITFETWDIGAAQHIQVTGSAAVTLGLDSDVHFGTGGDELVPDIQVDALTAGAAGNEIYVEVLGADPQSGVLDIRIYVGPDVVETFTGVFMGDLESVINDPVTGSHLVHMTILPEGGAVPDEGTFPLTGGSDAGLPDATFIGSEADGTGLYAFDNVPDIALLIVPGRATPAVHSAMLTYCEQHRDGMMFAILDPPAGLGAADMVTYVSTTASLENASEYGAIYWPRVKVLNPKRSVFGDDDQIVVAPSGILAGLFARTDGARPGGVYDQPAGVEAGRLFGVLGFETTETRNERKRDLVFPHRINPITTRPGRSVFADGARTLKGSGSFPFVGGRRGVIFIERSLKQGLQFARHKNNTPELRSQVRRAITAFLVTQTQNGAFASKDPSKAFFVDVSDQLNTPSVVAAGKLIARIGLAISTPAEYVVLQISQDTRALEAELAAGG